VDHKRSRGPFFDHRGACEAGNVQTRALSVNLAKGWPWEAEPKDDDDISQTADRACQSLLSAERAAVAARAEQIRRHHPARSCLWMIANQVTLVGRAARAARSAACSRGRVSRIIVAKVRSELGRAIMGTSGMSSSGVGRDLFRG
jgi:hypothetical protein